MPDAYTSYTDSQRALTIHYAVVVSILMRGKIYFDALKRGYIYITHNSCFEHSRRIEKRIHSQKKTTHVERTTNL